MQYVLYGPFIRISSKDIIVAGGPRNVKHNVCSTSFQQRRQRKNDKQLSDLITLVSSQMLESGQLQHQNIHHLTEIGNYSPAKLFINWRNRNFNVFIQCKV